MSVFDMAIQDFKDFTTNTDSGAGAVMTFTAPNGATATVAGVRTKHWESVGEDGEKVNAKNASLSVSEQVLTAAGYPVRNSYGSVDFKGHKVSVTDANGLLCVYATDEWFPDEAMGLITCMMGDFE